ncbi:MAG: carboxymuconolactone decarboxylase family protein [Solirubrobacterales bacterium]
MTKMPRPALVVPEQTSPPVREALAALPQGLGVFRMLAHAETAFRPWLALGGSLLGSLQLDPALRELAILRVAVVAGCDYERIQHEAIAAGVGARPDQVAALAALRTAGKEFDRREELVLRFVDEVIANDGSAAASVAEVEEALSAREVVELLLVISQYYGLALLLNTTRVEPDPPAAMAVVEAAQSNRDAQP